MKVLISSDMEGTSGVVDFSQVISSDHAATFGLKTSTDFEWVRKLVVKEVNAAVEGAFEGGATEVFVNEAHNGMRNLLPEELHLEAKLISGTFKPLGMMQGIDNSFGAVIFTGYHAGAGTVGGILAHSFCRSVQEIRLNGQRVGECGFNAAIAGHFGVPVVMISGDDKVIQEARELLGEQVVGVAVKEGISAIAAVHLHPEKARTAIKEGARRGVAAARDIPPFRVDTPVRMEIDVSSPTLADLSEQIPGVERVGRTSIAYTGSDMLQAAKAWRIIMNITLTPLPL